ncbi:MAG TPA: hypothetical protein VE177_01270, partial [Candidatus Binatus sp.]|nr:hypothetical protein [Candidatus Binatus sp.]
MEMMNPDLSSNKSPASLKEDKQKLGHGFKGFYGLLGGSLPDSSSILIAGDSGSGKTTLAQ